MGPLVGLGNVVRVGLSWLDQCPYEKGHQKACFLLCFNPRRELSFSQLDCPLDLGLPASRTMRKEISVESPSLWYFVMAAWDGQDQLPSGFFMQWSGRERSCYVFCTFLSTSHVLLWSSVHLSIRKAWFNQQCELVGMDWYQRRNSVKGNCTGASTKVLAKVFSSCSMPNIRPFPSCTET